MTLVRTASLLFGVTEAIAVASVATSLGWRQSRSGEVVQKAPTSALIIEMATITVDPRGGHSFSPGSHIAAT
jgi:hypothetical protein